MNIIKNLKWHEFSKGKPLFDESIYIDNFKNSVPYSRKDESGNLILIGYDLPKENIFTNENIFNFLL